jgi:hypothetical protein
MKASAAAQPRRVRPTIEHRLKKASKDIPIALRPDEALVLYDLLARSEERGRIETLDPSEEWVLSVVHGKLERQLVAPLDTSCNDLLAEARRRLRDHIE